MKISTDSYFIKPPKGVESPACFRCFEPTTGINIESPDLASRTKAKLLGIQLPNLLVVAKPCGHQYSDEHWQAWKSATGLKTDISIHNDAHSAKRSSKRKNRKSK